MAYRVKAPEEPLDGNAQVAELIVALQTQDALMMGAMILAVGVFLFAMDALQRTRHRADASKVERDKAFRALRQARSRRLADTTLH
ncbi:MAG: hypothetical protein AAF371_11925 [Pseudomonadota bacterium]